MLLQIKTKDKRLQPIKMMIIRIIIKKHLKNQLKKINEINQNDLLYYLKINNSRKRFDDFNNGVEFFEKIKSSKMKLEEAN